MGSLYARQISDCVQVLNRVSAIDLTATGTTNLYTVPSGKTAILWVVLEVTTGGATGAAAAGVGIASGEDDIHAVETLTSFTTAGKIWKFVDSGLSRTASASSVVKLGVDTAATGGSLLVKAHVFGYLY